MARCKVGCGGEECHGDAISRSMERGRRRDICIFLNETILPMLWRTYSTSYCDDGDALIKSVLLPVNGSFSVFKY